MDDGVVVPPEQVIAALKLEKAQLEKRLETENDESEREIIQERIDEIYSCFAQPAQNVVSEPPPEPVTEPRRSGRERCPTEKMKELLDQDIKKRERKFITLYQAFKTEVQLVRMRLKKECSKPDLEGHAKDLKECQSDVINGY